MPTPFQREVAAAFRPQAPLAQRARVLQTLRTNAQTNPVGLAQALDLPTPSTGSALNTLSTAASAASLALAPAEIAAELALGTNPFTAIPLVAFDIASLTGLLPSFSGKPKLQDSVQAIQRLAQSRNPAIQQLAANLAVYARNGVPLSTSNPAQQAQIRDWIAGTIQTILAERGAPASASNVALLDQSIRNVITSEVANPGSKIDNAVAAIGGGASAQPQGLSLRPIRSANPGPSIPQPSVPQPGLPSASPSSSLPARVLTFLAQSGLLGGLPTLSVQDAEALGHCVELLFTHGEARAVLCVGDLIARQIGDAGRKFLQAVKQAFQTFEGQPQTGQPGGTPSQPAPILDQKSDCPGCNPKTRALQRGLKQQETRTLRDIEREQETLTEEELSQQAEELSQIESLEGQPQTPPLIQKTLAQKRQLLQQIQSEQEQLGGTQGGQPAATPGQPAPALQPSSSQAAQQEIEQELAEQHGVQSVQFCVGCKSQEDAILFLNGEPSQCSVIPGSTREVNYPTS